MKKKLQLFENTIIALLAALVFTTGVAQAQADKPNIILIVSDDTGYGDLGPYGGGEVHPTIALKPAFQLTDSQV